MKHTGNLILMLCCLLAYPLFSQQTSPIEQLLELERNAVEALALYPQKERLAILNAATAPQVLVHMQHVRARTETAFQNLLEPLNDDTREAMYNLARFPELIEALTATGSPLPSAQMEQAVADYPDNVHQQAASASRNHFGVLVSMRDLYREASERFAGVLHNHPEHIREAYRVLVGLPDVTEILTDNMTMTVLLGDLYQRYPDLLMQELDALGADLAEQNAKDLLEWKRMLEEDPEAMAEYENVLRDFADDHGYDDVYYDPAIHDKPAPAVTETRVIVHHVWRPYPYWFGRPWWYTYNMWYPYPWWYHCGYYYGPGNTIVFVNLPSGYFFNWYLYRYHHFYHYPHFTGHMFGYYYGPRRASTVHYYVGGWLREHSDEVPETWLAERETRIDRIREYGKFRTDYERTVRETGRETLTPREFVSQHPDRYPRVKELLAEAPIRDVSPAPVRRADPIVPAQPPATRLQPREKVIEPQTPPERRIDRARDHHQQSWERTNPRPPATRQQRTISPASRQQQPTQQPQRRTPTQRGGGG